MVSCQYSTFCGIGPLSRHAKHRLYRCLSHMTKTGQAGFLHMWPPERRTGLGSDPGFLRDVEGPTHF